MSTAKALPQATQDAVPHEIDQSEISCNFSDSNDLKNSNPHNHKQRQCLDFRGEPLNDNKQNLSKLEPIAEQGIYDVVTSADSNVDSRSHITLQGENAPVASLSIPVSIPIAAHGSVEGEDSLPVFVEQDSPPQQQTFTSDDHRIATRLKLQATAIARQRVKLYCTIENLSLRPQERIKLEQLALRLLMLESPSLILQQEAQQWLAANPDALSSPLVQNCPTVFRLERSSV